MYSKCILTVQMFNACTCTYVQFTAPPSLPLSLLLVHESELSHQLQHLAEQVDTFSQFRRIKNSNRKRNSLIKAFCEFYYHLSLLQNFQVHSVTYMYMKNTQGYSPWFFPKMAPKSIKFFTTFSCIY